MINLVSNIFYSFYFVIRKTINESIIIAIEIRIIFIKKLSKLVHKYTKFAIIINAITPWTKKKKINVNWS